jgi:polar amino acid transport system substrate-binding protein
MSLQRIVLLLVISLSAAVVYGESALESLLAKGKATVGVKVDSPPFGYTLAGTNVGFDVDIINAVLARIGVEEVEFVPVTSANRIDKVLDGSVDLAIASMTITRSRDRQVDFSMPYFQDGQGLLVAVDSEIQDRTDLDGRTVGAVAGSTSLATLGEVAPLAKVEAFEDFKALKKALEDGKIEAITSDRLILIGLARTAKGGRDAWRLAGDGFTSEPYGIALPENQSDLRDAINEALQGLWEDGEYQVIFDAWFGATTPYAGVVEFSLTTFPK